MIKSNNLISIRDLESKELKSIFTLARKVKKTPALYKNALAGKTIALIFQKPSNRTRVSFEAGMTQLGGHAIYLDESHIKFSQREAVGDVATTLSRYVDGIVARTFLHTDLEKLAQHASVPTINGLSDLLHPCQALSDIFTITERFSDVSRIKFAYVGDGNNVLHSLIHATAKVGMSLTIATPRGYEPRSEIVSYGRRMTHITLVQDPIKAAEGADVVYTDVWASMGQESERQKRLKAFRKYQVNSRLLSYAHKNCLVMHCLPAHRGEEITDSVIDSPDSIVFDQAENRLHVQKAILLQLLKGK
jgi:ornithine carbamoyltransferase